MTVSPIKIIGSLVYRTRQALNDNKEFLVRLKSYEYAPNCLIDGKFSFWHYPGTPNEISNVLIKIGNQPNGIRLKYPSVFNFQPVRQEKSSNHTTMYFNLAFVGLVLSEWLTEQREAEVFDKLLRPVYDEFMKQIVRSGYFQLGYGFPSHQYYEVFTTGNNSGVLLERYGDYIDAIELHNLKLTLNKSLCEKDLIKMEKEYSLVTENYIEILKQK